MSIDTTPTHEVTSPDIPRFVFNIQKIQQTIGIMRPINRIIPSNLLGANERNGYTEAEIRYIRRFMNHIANSTITNQNLYLNNNVREIMEMVFPDDIPVLKIVPTRQGAGVNDNMHINHLNRLGENAEMVTIQGDHMLYRGSHIAVSEGINAFLNR